MAAPARAPMTIPAIAPPESPPPPLLLLVVEDPAEAPAAAAVVELEDDDAAGLMAPVGMLGRPMVPELLEAPIGLVTLADERPVRKLQVAKLVPLERQQDGTVPWVGSHMLQSCELDEAPNPQLGSLRSPSTQVAVSLVASVPQLVHETKSLLIVWSRKSPAVLVGQIVEFCVRSKITKVYMSGLKFCLWETGRLVPRCRRYETHLEHGLLAPGELEAGDLTRFARDGTGTGTVGVA